MLSSELGHELRQEREQAEEGDPAYYRNGSTSRTVLTPEGSQGLQTPRDRQATFDPVLVSKRSAKL